MGKAEVVIVAAGKGKRIKSKTPKPFIVLQGKPILFYSLKIFQNHPKINGIILVVGKSGLKKAHALINKYKFSKVKYVTEGGKERKDSVINGLRRIDQDTKFVLIHDAARPFVKNCLITGVLKALRRYKAAIPGVPAQDTLKTVDSRRIVKKTLNRENLYYIQTPQGIRTEILPLILKNYSGLKIAHDDAMLVEQKVKVKVVPSSPENFKITTPEDLLLAEAYLSNKK